MPETRTVCIHPSNTVRLTRILNEQALAGKTCVSLSRTRNKVILRTEPTAPDAPPCLWLAVPWTAFYQPTGWDYTLHNDSYVLYTRPLPAGTVAEKPKSSFRTRVLAEDAVSAEWLTEQARAGKQLVAAWQGMYYFAPAEPADVTYTLTPPNPDTPHAVTDANGVEANRDGLVFIAATDSTDIYADRPGQVPPHHGEKVPYDLWKPAMREARLAHDRSIYRLIAFLGGLIAVMPLIGLLCGLRKKEITMMFFLGAFVMGIAVLLVMTTFRLYQKSDAGRLLDTCKAPRQYPRHPPSTTQNTEATLHQMSSTRVRRWGISILGALIALITLITLLSQ